MGKKKKCADEFMSCPEPNLFEAIVYPDGRVKYYPPQEPKSKAGEKALPGHDS